MKLSVTPALSQTTIRQQHHNNITSENPEEYYRRAIVIPLLDRLKQEISLHSLNFLTKFQNCFTLSHQSYVYLDFHSVSEYEEDLPNHEIADQEIRLWKQCWLAQNEENRSSVFAT